MLVRTVALLRDVKRGIGLRYIVKLNGRGSPSQGRAKSSAVAAAIACSLNEERRCRASEQDFRIALVRLVLGMKRKAEHEEPVGLESIGYEPGGYSTSYAYAAD